MFAQEESTDKYGTNKIDKAILSTVSTLIDISFKLTALMLTNAFSQT